MMQAETLDWLVVMQAETLDWLMRESAKGQSLVAQRYDQLMFEWWWGITQGLTLSQSAELDQLWPAMTDAEQETANTTWISMAELRRERDHQDLPIGQRVRTVLHLPAGRYAN